MGASGAYQAMAKFPGFFAGAVPISYVPSPSIFHQGNVGPMWIVINRGDGDYEERLKNFRQHYEYMGGTLKETVYDQKNHDAWNRLVSDPAFRDWLFRRELEDLK
jgi:predicted peptidase